jgi:hypothetical protein
LLQKSPMRDASCGLPRLVRHAASTVVTARAEKARTIVHELLDQAPVSEEIFETSDFAKAHRARADDSFVLKLRREPPPI